MSPQQVISGLMLLAGLGLLTFLLLRGTHRRLPRRRGSEPAIAAQPRPTESWAGAHHDWQASLDRQQVELAEFRREVVAMVDSKLLVLRELIAMSDERIARLESLLAELRARDQPPQ